MQTLASTLLLSCCFWAVLAQSQDGEEQRRSFWEDPIVFATKAKDKCSMLVMGQGELTNLRISCQSRGSSYWCDYQGRPHICRPYNNNPRHFFTQIMWGLRKLRNACQGPTILKSFMCKKAPDEAQMVFITSSSTYNAPREEFVQPAWTEPDTMETPWQARPDYTKSDQAQPEKARPNGARPRPSKPRTKPTRPMKVVKPKTTTLKTTAPPPTTPGPTSTAKRMAQQHCWPSLKAVCAFVIGWFTY